VRPALRVGLSTTQAGAGRSRRRRIALARWQAAEQRIAESKAALWAIVIAWVAVISVLSIIPFIALSLRLVGLRWR
jgi:hypothetical protein